MENEKKPEMPADDSWFDELLARPEMGNQIDADEQAVNAAGLSDLADMELEQIILETQNMDIPLVDDPELAEVLAQAEQMEIIDDIPSEVTDATLVCLPSTPAPETMDATMVHTIESSNDVLWELPAEEESAAEEEPRELPDVPFLDDEYKDTFGETGEELEVVFSDMYEAKKEKPVRRRRNAKTTRENPTREKPEAKGRPKMKKGYGLFGLPHVVATLIWLAIILAIGVSFGRMLWVITTDVLAFGRESRECIVTISEYDNMDTIANKLKNAGLIKYPELFKMYADLTDAEEEITAGTFTLNTKYDYMALVNYMSAQGSVREEVEVLIPEGYTCAQIFALLEEKGVCKAADLEEYAANGAFGDYWFLEDVTRGTAYCLEGYLFPDTYKFYTNDKPGRVLNKFLDNFDYRFTDIMKDKLDVLNSRMAKVMAANGYSKDYIASHQFTLRDIVIIASMIEKETANDGESYDVSSVIYNRLTNAKEYPYLNIDATLIYALGGNIDPETGKTKPLTSTDLKMDHPYNTYTEKGMIPGPISNPGRNSLYAALDPNETNYYFYVFNPKTGVHLFAKNSKDHQKNVDYVRSLEKN